MTLVFFNNLRLKRGCLINFENNQFKLVAIRPYSLKTLKVLAYTLSCSVSLLTSALNFQTIIAGARHTVTFVSYATCYGLSVDTKIFGFSIFL